jgi:hypothetical protein|tara:strand:+ start:149 stop:526 length:378 start_codon:yes stop_codon:yes gene_type:complete
MYYIYHIEGVKIGVSTNPSKRVQRQGYTDFKILEEHTDINVVSIRETELQKQYGYAVDKVLYKNIHHRHRKRKLTTEQEKFIKDNYYRCSNQNTQIPKGKYNIPQLAEMIGVTKRIISLSIKRNS